MPTNKNIISVGEWDQIDKAPLSDLATDIEHNVQIPREAIPIIFVPGVMGSRLRLKGTNGEGKGGGGLPNLRWTAGTPISSPGAFRWLWWNYSNETPLHRKRMLIGDGLFNEDYLEVDNHDSTKTDPKGVGNGFAGLIPDYIPFLEQLRDRDWGGLGKLFVFPVYAFGYNWTGDNKKSGEQLSKFITDIKTEANKIINCEKVILITHSMGGLVARSASKDGAENNILGIIHGVQPTLGAPAAYWRMKAGFEAGGGLVDRIKGEIGSCFLGNTGPSVTAVLANSIGGLQLLPNHLYPPKWLQVDGHEPLPKSDPYKEIYEIKADVNLCDNYNDSDSYWGLVDPKLLEPGDVKIKVQSQETDIKKLLSFNLMDILSEKSNENVAWNGYKDKNLKLAESFHRKLGDYQHPKTWHFWGKEKGTTARIYLKVEHYTQEYDYLPDPSGYGYTAVPIPKKCYPIRGFRSYFKSAAGVEMQVVLKAPSDDGDGTVPIDSAKFLITKKKPRGNPKDKDFSVEHQSAYEIADVQKWVICAITGLCRERLYDRRTELIPPELKEK